MRTTWTAALVFGSCAALRRALESGGARDLGPIRLRPLWNRGAAFGLPVPSEAIPPLSLATLAAVLSQRKRHPVAVGLILGGGLSNLWERTRLGGVLDYVQLARGPGKVKEYVYNLADFSIFAGALGLLGCPGGKNG